MTLSRRNHNIEDPDEGPYRTLLWRICRHTCFILLGIGMALVMGSILGYQDNAWLFLVTFFPGMLKLLLLVGSFAFMLIFVESMTCE